jgi:hypothetical protein
MPLSTSLAFAALLDAMVTVLRIHGPRRAHPADHHDRGYPAKDLFAPYAEQVTVENELDAYTSGFHLDALTTGVPPNVDLETTRTVVARKLYRLLAPKLSRYENANPRSDLAALPRRHHHPH